MEVNCQSRSVHEIAVRRWQALLGRGVVGTLSILVACGQVSVMGADAGLDGSDGAGPAGCVLASPFGPPSLVAGVNSPGVDVGEAGATLSLDELTIYFASNRRSPGSADFDIYAARRNRADEAFMSAERIDAVSTTSDERGPWIAQGGLALYFHSSRSGNYDLYVATRESLQAPFGAPQALGTNTAATETGAKTGLDGRTLYFGRDTGSGGGVFRASLGPGGFVDAALVPELGEAGAPLPTDGERGVWFMSLRPGGVGGVDVYRASRSTTDAPFNQITNVAEVNSQAFDLADWVSPDGCRLYLTSTRGGGFDIWMAERPR